MNVSSLANDIIRRVGSHEKQYGVKITNDIDVKAIAWIVALALEEYDRQKGED